MVGKGKAHNRHP